MTTIYVDYKNRNFKKTVDVFFDKYKMLAEDIRSRSLTIIQFFLSATLAFLIAYVGWQSESFIKLVSTLLSVNFSVQYILVSAIVMTFLITFVAINLIVRIKPVQNAILKLFRIDDYDKCMNFLHRLYMVKLDPKGWSIRYEIDQEKNILRLLELTYKQP